MIAAMTGTGRLRMERNLWATTTRPQRWGQAVKPAPSHACVGRGEERVEPFVELEHDLGVLLGRGLGARPEEVQVTSGEAREREHVRCRPRPHFVSVVVVARVRGGSGGTRRRRQGQRR